MSNRLENLDLDGEEQQQPEEAAPRAAVASAVKMKITGATVTEATKGLPPEQRDAIRWLYEHGMAQRWNTKELAEKVLKGNGTPYSAAQVYGAFTGKRSEEGAGLGNFCEAVWKYRRAWERTEKLERERSKAAPGGFVRTKAAERLWKAAKHAGVLQKVVFVFGPTQSGKTAAALTLGRAGLPVEPVYVRCPTRGILGEFLTLLAEALRVPTSYSQAKTKTEIFRALDGGKLLVVDEAHQCLPGKGAPATGRSLAVLEFVREIHDRCGCGVVVIGTPRLEEEMDHGPHKVLLAQLKQRGLLTVRLPGQPTRRDLDAFGREFGLPDMTDAQAALAAEVCAADSLGKWKAILRAANYLAQSEKKALTWGLVAATKKELEES